MFLPHPRVKVNIVGSLRDREVACSTSDRQGSNLESCVWRTVSSHSSHHPQEVLLAQFSLYVHKGGLMPDSFNFMFGQYKKSTSLYNIVEICEIPLPLLNNPLCTRYSLFLELFLERLLFQFALVTNDHDIKSVPRL